MGVLSLLLGEIHLPEGFSDARDWRPQVAKAATALRVGLLSAPEHHAAVAGSGPIGPNALAGRGANLDLLITAGFAPSTAARLHLTIVHYVIGFVLAERPESAAYGTAYKRTLKRYYQRLPADTYPSIAALADELTTRDIDREFAFGSTWSWTGSSARQRSTARPAAASRADPRFVLPSRPRGTLVRGGRLPAAWPRNSRELTDLGRIRRRPSIRGRTRDA